MTALPLQRADETALLHWGGPHAAWGNLGLWAGQDTTYADAAQALATWVFDRAGLHKAGRVVCAGCGSGEELRLAIESFRVQQVIGIDLGTPADRRLRLPAERVRWLAARLPSGTAAIDSGSCDAVVSVDAAYHFSPRAAWLAQALSWLRPQGALVFADLVVTHRQPTGWSAAPSRLAGIDRREILSIDEGVARLREAGFAEASAVDLGEPVLDGFERYVQRQNQVLAQALGLRRASSASLAWALPGWRRVLATAALIRHARQRGWSYAVFSGRRPPG